MQRKGLKRMFYDNPNRVQKAAGSSAKKTPRRALIFISGVEFTD
jgi:hypothetical protein